jgi:two-component system, OmpR family, phosphate regulon response regulator PhoB
VDDNDVLRLLLTHALESAGYVAIPADSAETALEAVRLDPPDLCLVDHVMPGMSGADLIRALSASTDARLRAVRAIGLTGWAGAEAELLAAGAVAAIRKPIEEGPLLDDVRRLLAG